MTSSAVPPYLDQIPLGSLAGMCDYVSVTRHDLGDGRFRRIYRGGDRNLPVVVLLPPYGMSFLLVLKLMMALRADFHVLTWESAGCPDPETEVVDSDFTLESQSADLVRMLSIAGVEAFHIVGWCQAAQLIVHAMATHGVSPLSMSWLAPGGFGLSVVMSEFDRCALPIYLEIARQGPSGARKLGGILDKYRDAPATGEPTGERLTMLHLPSPDMTCTFARYMKCYEDNKPLAQACLSKALGHVPLQIIHCRDDGYSHYSESVEIARRHAGVELVLIDTGGHLQVFDAAAVPASYVIRHAQASRPMTA